MNDGDIGEILQHELIGLHSEVTGSTDPGRVGLSGTVADESRNTLVLETPGGMKIVPKSGTTFRFAPRPGLRPEGGAGEGEGRFVSVRGDRLLARPEDRVKKNAPRGGRGRGGRGSRRERGRRGGGEDGAGPRRKTARGPDETLI